jgi:ABC-type sulfate/molybdate transport systems ATPase subunit
VTHDIAETADFDRVLVLEDGRIAEDGKPQALLGDPSSLYARLFQAERATLDALATSERWRRLEFVEGRLVPKDPPRREEPR